MKGFNSLPADIIEIIFQMAYENEDDGFLPLKYAHPRSRKAVTGRKLLVPLHISSWIRAVNLSNSAVWSSSAEMVLASQSKRKGNARLFHLLRFCADRSSALKRLDFNQIADDRSLWAQEMSPFLDIIEASATSIEHLRLHDLYQRFPEQCSCSACTSSGELDPTTPSSSSIESVWTRLFNVLCRASSLKSVDLNHLFKVRRDFSSGKDDSYSSPLGKFKALKSIQMKNLQVDKESWRSLVESGNCDEVLCDPDPLTIGGS